MTVGGESKNLPVALMLWRPLEAGFTLDDDAGIRSDAKVRAKFLSSSIQRMQDILKL